MLSFQETLEVIKSFLQIFPPYKNQGFVSNFDMVSTCEVVLDNESPSQSHNLQESSQVLHAFLLQLQISGVHHLPQAVTLEVLHILSGKDTKLHLSFLAHSICQDISI